MKLNNKCDNHSQLGLISAAVYLPEDFEDAQYISKKSGIPLNVVKEKMGIIKKCRAPKNLHPSQMAISAAQSALKDIDPKSIDLIIWTGSEYKDHPVWSAGIFVQNALGCTNAFSFDVSARCSSNVLGLKIAQSMALSDSKIKRILICGGHKTGDLVNYKDPSSRFLFNLSDGGSALVLEKGGVNPILNSSIITDGEFSLDVIIPGGGTKKPYKEGLKEDEAYLTVPQVDAMRERLGEKSLPNFLKVIKEAATTSLSKPIDYLALLHMKKSAHEEILKHLELKEDQSIYLNRYGHFGAPDQVLSLGLAERYERLHPQSHVVLASAGIGYTWSAISILWEKPIFQQHTIDEFEKEETYEWS